MGTTMQHPRPWLLPLPQQIIGTLICGLSGEREQGKVDYDGQGDARENAHQEPK
jgi:hypothetical protein